VCSSDLYLTHAKKVWVSAKFVSRMQAEE
jgi:hypothetical protein